MELQRPPWYTGLLLLLAGLVSLLYISPSLVQLAHDVKPVGAWRVQVGSQAFAVRIGPQVVGQGAPLTTSAPQPVGYELTTDAEHWGYDLATRLGNPAPSFETIMFLVAWQRAEGGSAQFNPLNTIQSMPGATCYNPDPCVKNFLTRDDGLQATLDTLAAGHNGYQDIREGITSNDPERALRGLHASPWGTSAALAEEVYRELVQSPVPIVGDAVAAEPALPAQPVGGKSWPATSTQVNAGFYTVNCAFWSFQAGCQHFGTDIHGAEGDPVFMPFDGTFKQCIIQPEGTPYVGVAWMANLMDGTELYIGHMRQGTCDLAPGTLVASGTQIGTFRGDTAHIHMQLKNVSGELLDFEEYYRQR